MINKEERAKLIAQAARLTEQLRQEDTIGGVLGFLAASPFNDTDAAEYTINALVATSTPEALAKAYNLSDAAATVLHGAAVANVTAKKRPAKNGSSAILKALAGVLAAKAGKADPDAKPAGDDKPDDDCQCPGCQFGRIMQGIGEAGVTREPDGTTTASFAFNAATPEEAKAMSERFTAEIAKGRNPLDLIKEMGGKLVDPDEIERAMKDGRATIQHVDISGKPITPH